MPSKRRKYNARFPAGRIKKIMQTDEEVGKVAQAVPIIISRTLELFVESLLRHTVRITTAKNAKTLSPSHMKQCIMSESQFDFLKDLVKSLPDVNTYDDEGSGAVCSNEGLLADTLENTPAMSNSSDPALSSLSGFSGPRHSGQADTNKPNNPHQKSLNKEETDSEECESVESDKADAADGNNSDFVIDEDYDA